MKLRNSHIGGVLALVLGLLVCGIASATPVVMNFDGLKPGTGVHNYYAGGCTTRNIFGSLAFGVVDI